MTPGAYRLPLAAGLKILGNNTLSQQTLNGDLKIAVESSIYGPVKRRDDLTGLYVEALKTLSDQGDAVALHYVRGLESGRFVPVVASGVDVIYTDGRTNPTPGPEKEWAPGELFMKS